MQLMKTKYWTLIICLISGCHFSSYPCTIVCFLMNKKVLAFFCFEVHQFCISFLVQNCLVGQSLNLNLCWCVNECVCVHVYVCVSVCVWLQVCVLPEWRLKQRSHCCFVCDISPRGKIINRPNLSLTNKW